MARSLRRVLTSALAVAILAATCSGDDDSVITEDGGGDDELAVESATAPTNDPASDDAVGVR